MPLTNGGYVGSIGSARLWRCGEIDGVAATALVTMGVTYDYKLNDEAEFPMAVESRLLSSAVVVVSDPWPRIGAPPIEKALRAAKQVIEYLKAGQSVVIHCTHGKDRTGLLVAVVELLMGWYSLSDVLQRRAYYGTNGFVDATFDREIVEIIHKVAARGDAAGKE